MRKLYLGIAFLGATSLAACGPYALTQAERDTAELGALQYAQADGGKFVSCSGSDSDGDKYVTCTIKPDASKNDTRDLLCGYQSRGCKNKA